MSISEAPRNWNRSTHFLLKQMRQRFVWIKRMKLKTLSWQPRRKFKSYLLAFSLPYITQPHLLCSWMDKRSICCEQDVPLQWKPLENSNEPKRQSQSSQSQFFFLLHQDRLSKALFSGDYPLLQRVIISISMQSVPCSSGLCKLWRWSLQEV